MKIKFGLSSRKVSPIGRDRKRFVVQDFLLRKNYRSKVRNFLLSEVFLEKDSERECEEFLSNLYSGKEGCLYLVDELRKRLTFLSAATGIALLYVLKGEPALVIPQKYFFEIFPILQSYGWIEEEVLSFCCGF